MSDSAVPRSQNRRAGWLTLPELLSGALLLAALGYALLRVSPWLLPVRIVEGPLIQHTATTAFTIVWVTTRPVAGHVAVRIAGQPRKFEVRSTATHNSATIDGLSPGESYEYEILAGDRPVPDGKGIVRTNKPAGESFRFVVFGDSGRGWQAQYKLAARMVENQPDFLLHTGDLIYPAGERADYARSFFTPYRRLIRNVAFWPSLGNHDIPNIDAYHGVFELPPNGPTGLAAEDNYWFDYSDARFVVLDSNASAEGLKEKISPWLRQVFAERPNCWKVVVFHHPPFTASRHKPNKKVHESLVPAINEAGVDIVFNGHNHLYERIRPPHGDGASAATSVPVYVVTGAGGYSLYETADANRPAHIEKQYNAMHSFTSVGVTADTMTVRQIALDGHEVDSFELKKSPPASHPQ